VTHTRRHKPLAASATFNGEYVPSSQKRASFGKTSPIGLEASRAHQRPTGTDAEEPFRKTGNCGLVHRAPGRRRGLPWRSWPDHWWVVFVPDDPSSASSALPGDGQAVGVVSPHLDDAALSCGGLLSSRPGSYVLTVFAAGPELVDPLPEWDLMSGLFRPGDDVMGLRAVEDDEAMATVGAHPQRLGFWDEQYRAGPPVRHGRVRRWAVRRRQSRIDDPAVAAGVEAKLAELIEQVPVRTWFIPLGLWHGDHKKTAAACLNLAARLTDRTWVVYEELPYRLEVPDQVEHGRHHLRAKGFAPQEVVLDGGAGRDQKRAMVNAYRSQLPCMGRRVEAAVSGAETFLVLGPARG
jgi:LmbE family N-acetylglucosaminyl deacetylase